MGANSGDLPWIGVEDPDQRYPESPGGARVILSRKPSLQTNTFTAMLEAVAHGLGVALLARPTAEGRGLREIATDLKMPGPHDVYLVTHRALRHVPRVDAMWTFIEPSVLAFETGADRGR